MNNKASIALLVSLVLVGIFFIVVELQAAPTTCYSAWLFCTAGCAGNFSYDYCWEGGGGLVYCYFWCVDHHIPCSWSDPIYGICVDHFKRSYIQAFTPLVFDDARLAELRSFGFYSILD